MLHGGLGTLLWQILPQQSVLTCSVSLNTRHLSRVIPPPHSSSPSQLCCAAAFPSTFHSGADGPPQACFSAADPRWPEADQARRAGGGRRIGDDHGEAGAHHGHGADVDEDGEAGMRSLPAPGTRA